MKTNVAAPLERIVIDDNANTFSEADPHHPHDVQLSTVDSLKKIVLIHLHRFPRGKTTVACNLALAFAQVKKTLFIEADMRRRGSPACWHRPRAPGPVRIRGGSMSIDQCIQPVNAPPCGCCSPQDSAQPARNAVPRSVRPMPCSRCRTKFDVIVIDSPAHAVGERCDGAVAARHGGAVVVQGGRHPLPAHTPVHYPHAPDQCPVCWAGAEPVRRGTAQRYYGYYSGSSALLPRLRLPLRFTNTGTAGKHGTRVTGAAATNNKGVA